MLLAVITISDRCSQGLLEDTAGPAVVGLLRGAWSQAEIRTALLADDEDAIAALLEKLSADGAALVLTVGGTGLGPRDRTPEATRRVMDREAFTGLNAEPVRMALTRRCGAQRDNAHRQFARQPARGGGEPELNSSPDPACAGGCDRRPEAPLRQSAIHPVKLRSVVGKRFPYTRFLRDETVLGSPD
jgi:molybdenum cofactor synthesis domain-containing protein